jgi:NRAMP (natural resistance-associated macrophage protein)-like metal ion transporter
VKNHVLRAPHLHKPLLGGLALFRRMGPWRRVGLFLAVAGPGLITGIVDDDATGIAGYAIAGSRFGYSLLWTLILAAVALAIVGEMAARMGSITGKGLGEVIRERFGVRITSFALLILLVANLATIVAEFAGIAGASEIFGVSRYIAVPLAALVVFAVVVYGSYRRVEKVLLAGALISISYIITGFLAKPDWGTVASHSVVPHFQANLAYLSVLIGVIGTTITPWQQFYLQSTVVDKGLGEREFKLERLDVFIGAAASATIAFFIIVTTAATLHAHGEPSGTVEEVAQSLRPLAGDFASRLFALGLLNASLLAAAVLPLTTAYAICGAFGWERSVSVPLREAPVFFGLFGGLLIVGAGAVLLPGVPILILLLIPNVLGAILLPVILILMLKVLNDKRIMGRWANSTGWNVAAWTVTGALIVLTVVYGVIAVLQAVGVVGG